MSAVEPYYQLEELKENLNEEDETPNENKLQNWGNRVDRYLDQKLLWLFDNDVTVFPLTAAKWTDIDFSSNEMTKLQELATAGVEAYFWKEENGQSEGWDNWKKEVDEWIKILTEIPATTESG